LVVKIMAMEEIPTGEATGGADVQDTSPEDSERTASSLDEAETGAAGDSAGTATTAAGHKGGAAGYDDDADGRGSGEDAEALDEKDEL
jgi:hypothetical protein